LLAKIEKLEDDIGHQKDAAHYISELVARQALQKEK
jgi:hypothetical protein